MQSACASTVARSAQSRVRVASRTAQQAHSQLEIRIYGSDGYVWLDPMAGTCSIFSSDGQLKLTAAERRIINMDEL